MEFLYRRRFLEKVQLVYFLTKRLNYYEILTYFVNVERTRLFESHCIVIVNSELKLAMYVIYTVDHFLSRQPLITAT